MRRDRKTDRTERDTTIFENKRNKIATHGDEQNKSKNKRGTNLCSGGGGIRKFYKYIFGIF